MSSNRKRGQTIHSEARAIIAKVLEECDEEKSNKQLSLDISKSTLRVANYTGVSKNTVINIRKEVKMAENGILLTPGKKRPRNSVLHTKSFDNFDRDVVRNTIQHFYVVERVVPTTAKLLPVLQEKIGFPWGVDSLRKILREMGFTFKKSSNKRSLLIERPDIVTWRYRYLKTVRQFRSEGRRVYYLDETWVDANLTFGKCWQAEGVRGIVTNHSSNNRLIVVSIGSEVGFVPESTLIFKAGASSGDYHGQMNGENFEKWISTSVIPNLQPGSVVVMDNAPYHSMQVDKPPTKYSTKQSMVAWLTKRGIQPNTSLRKPEIFDLVIANSPIEKRYKIDEILKSSGHSVLRLPPYMCDLNPIELGWAQIKKYIRERNTTGELSLKRLLELTKEAVNAVSRSHWAGFLKHTQTVEEEYWTKDGIMEDAVDSLIIPLGDLDDSDSSCGDSIDDEDDEEDLATFLEE